MAISKKNRRKIVVGDREYLWWVRRDWENYQQPGAPTLAVATDDRRMLLYYALNQAEEARHLVVLGSEFRGAVRPGLSGRYRCPAFGLPGEIHPSDVAAFITWCTTAEPLPVKVDWQGNPLRPSAIDPESKVA
ncbi:hypothetical protein AB0H76_08000 [Nocardia sp. NPDC050712]|uniref:hypothetical protein n=1 Tax=Nocardia sp. NPDC050712 TaxID=3155518 RepID=UPI0033E8B540